MLAESRLVRVRWRIALLAVVALLVATAASAKPKAAAPTPLQKQAAEHAATAAQALKTGDADTAVRELKTAQGLASNLDIEVDLSRAEVLSGDVLGGRETLKKALATYDASLGSRRATLEAELIRVEGRLVRLKLDVSEPDATVKLDEHELGVTPLAEVALNPGAHLLDVSKAGFVPVTRQLDLRSGPTTLSLDLAPVKATGRLVVTAPTATPLAVTLNGKPAGALPLQADLPPGTYQIEATSGTERAQPQTVPVVLGQTTSVTLALAAVPGTANVSAGAADAAIYIDDRWVATGQWHGELAPGAHQLRVERKGYELYRQPLDVASGERVVVDQIAYVPLGTAKPDDELTAYDGLFVDVDLLATFGPGSTNSITQDCAANATGGDCSSTRPAGGGLGVRVGYSFGWIAAEGLLLGSADAATANANYAFGTGQALGAYYGAPREERYVFVRYGGGIGAGARVMTRDPTFRVTGGLDGVLLFRTAQYARATTASSAIPAATNDNSQTQNYVSPGFMADLGILIGSTPGFKFHTGIALLVEFPPDPVTTPGVSKNLGHDATGQSIPYGTPPIDLSRGPQMVVGPFLAMQFGH